MADIQKIKKNLIVKNSPAALKKLHIIAITECRSHKKVPYRSSLYTLHLSIDLLITIRWPDGLSAGQSDILYASLIYERVRYLSQANAQEIPRERQNNCMFDDVVSVLRARVKLYYTVYISCILGTPGNC